MPTLSPCPNHERLLALKRGDLEGDSLEQICQHLSDCCDCDQALAALEDADDEIVGNLRQFLNREPLIKREDCKRLEERAQAIPIDHLELLPPSSALNEDSPTTPRESAIPKRLGKYQLGRKLGRGGMGIVFAATHIDLHREVAIKVIVPECAGDPRMLARFRREVKAVGQLKHENIVTATDAGDAEGHHFLVMEIVDGMDLDALLRANGPLPVADACEIIRQAALGLQYVHEQGGVHRDLKPSNLMLAIDGRVKILDLGLARVFSDRGTSGTLTRSSQVMGTDDYMAPEQWDDSSNVDIRADIYSLGCTLYKILTGDALYGGPEYKPLPKKKAAHRLLEPPSIRVRRPEVSTALSRVLERSLEKDRGARFATPLELADALAPFAHGNDCRLLIANGKQLAAGTVPRAAGTPGTRPETVDSPWKLATPRQTTARRFIALAGRKPWPVIIGVLLAAGVIATVVIIVGGDKNNVDTVKNSGSESGTREIASKPKLPEVDPALPKTDPALPKVDPKLELLLQIKIPDSDGPLEVGRTRKLLTQTPARLYWKNEVFGHFVQTIHDSHEVFAYVPFVGLLGLGKTEYPAYRFQVGIRQATWTGGAGLFFGYHETVYKEKRCFRYQYLYIRPFKSGFVIERHVRMQFPDHGDTAFDDSYANANIGKLANGREYILGIVVKGKALAEVTWNGAPLRDLTKDEHNAGPPFNRLTEADYFGQFGTFSRQSSSVFGNAYIMLHERGTP